MKKSTSLCFTKEGLINPSALKFIQNKDHVDTLILFGDGSVEAFEHMKLFSDNELLKSDAVKHIAINRTPKYEMRVDKGDGDLSSPNYLYENDSKDKWFCSKVAAPHLSISITDVTSPNSNKTQLDREAKEALCFLSHKLWTVMLLVEERLCFPAVAIDTMTKWTYNLSYDTIDIDLLRKETGLSTLDYNPKTDLLEITVGQETFVVKLTVLNETYGTLILPLFRSLKGRRLNISVAIHGNNGDANDSTDMTYGQLGRLIESMRIYIREKAITVNNPIPKDDLLEWAKRVSIKDESCIWLGEGETVSSAIDALKEELLFYDRTDDVVCENGTGIAV